MLQMLTTKPIEKNDGFLQIYKFMNVKTQNEIIEIKCI